MASIISATYPFCMDWTTELPFTYKRRISPSIFLEREFEWNLQLSNFGMMQYELSMVPKIEKPVGVPKWCNYKYEPSCWFSVTTFIHSGGFFNSRSPLISNTNVLKYDSHILWCKTTDEVSAVIPNIFTLGQLTITCVIHRIDTQIYKTPSVHVSTQTALNIVDLQNLSRDFSTFLKDETFSDMKLKCAGCTFSANRFILSARSEVFAAMFRNKVAEAEAGEVDIKDIEPEVLEQLLEYMYSAERPDLCEETAYRLYEAADKYAVHGLRQACSDWMVEHLRLDNCLDLFVLTDKHSDENFKEAVACFVAKHLADLSVESWSTFKNKYPSLVLLVLEKRCEDSIPGAAKRVKYDLSTGM